VRESKGRIPLKIVKDLFEVLPKVTAQFFKEFREGRITFHDLKLESLGLDHTKFLTSAKILELAFPDDDLKYLPVWMQEKRAKVVDKLKAKIAEEEASNVDKNLVANEPDAPASPTAVAGTKEAKLGKIGSAIREGLTHSVEPTNKYQ
jgi:hypothetical protein